MLTALFVAARIVANPVSNVFQKKLVDGGAHPVFVIAATHALLTLAVAPFVGWTLVADAGFWFDIGLCAALAVAGNVLLVAALRRTDLSILGPINAYKAVVSLGLAVVVLGEVPSWWGLAGVGLIVGGSAVVMEGEGAFGRFFRDRGVQLRFAALACSATEAVFLKRAILRGSPATVFVWWCVLGLVGALLLRGRTPARLPAWRAGGSLYVWLATTTGVMQATTLFTFGRMPVGYSLALFQLSSLISVFLGHRYFQEPHLGRRLAASGIMAVGAAMLLAQA